MRFTVREGRKDDFESWFTIECACFQRGEAWKANARHEWDTFFERGVMSALAIEEADAGEPAPIRAFAGGVFVTDRFSHWLREGQSPYTLIHATQPLPDNTWPLLKATEIAARNAGNGLNLMLTHWTWAEPILSPAAAQDVRVLLEQEFFRRSRGYHLKEILVEGLGREHRERCERAGFHCINDYKAYYRAHPPAPTPPQYPYLMAVTREEARQQDGCALLRSFCYTPPRFFFTEDECLLLREALNKKSDEQIARVACVSLPTIKNRWQSIFDTVEFGAPGLLPERRKDGKRGKECRTVILQYVDAHPEELRPYARSH